MSGSEREEARRAGGPGGARDVIAIDGGAGTGKTTSAARTAERLGFTYIDSGAVYRAIAVALRAEGILDPDDARVEGAVRSLPIELRPEPGRFRVFLGARELTGELRTPEISRLSSQLAVRPEVRVRVRALLREAAVRGSLVVEGRDIGTVVFPDAVLKVHLHAALPVRAERRQADLRRQGIDMPAGEVSRDLEERDRRDSTRADSPLRQAEGALVLDTSRCSIDEQVDAILRAYFAAVRATRAPEGPAGPEASRPPEGERP